MVRAGSTVLRTGHAGCKYVVEQRDGASVTCRDVSTDEIVVCDSSTLTPVGFPHAANTVLGPCSPAAATYPCFYHDATADTAEAVGAAALNFVHRDWLARNEGERRGEDAQQLPLKQRDWVFHVGTGRAATVTDALSEWRMGTGEVLGGALHSGALTPTGDRARSPSENDKNGSRH